VLQKLFGTSGLRSGLHSWNGCMRPTMVVFGIYGVHSEQVMFSFHLSF
jgi:hypothetical protein